MICEKCLEGQFQLIDKEKITENDFYKRRGFLWSKLYRITDTKIIATYKCNKCGESFAKVLDSYREEVYIRDSFDEIVIPFSAVIIFIIVILFCLIEEIGAKKDLLIIGCIIISSLIMIHLGFNLGLPKKEKEND